MQKLTAYSRLYSFASTKSVVRWFHIMRSGRFLMYDDDLYVPVRRPTNKASTPVTA